MRIGCTALYIYAKYKENDYSKNKKIKNLSNSFASEIQTNEQMEYFFKKDFLKAYFLIHFNCGLVPYHHIKCKLE